MTVCKRSSCTWFVFLSTESSAEDSHSHSRMTMDGAELIVCLICSWTCLKYLCNLFSKDRYVTYPLLFVSWWRIFLPFANLKNEHFLLFLTRIWRTNLLVPGILFWMQCWPLFSMNMPPRTYPLCYHLILRGLFVADGESLNLLPFAFAFLPFRRNLPVRWTIFTLNYFPLLHKDDCIVRIFASTPRYKTMPYLSVWSASLSNRTFLLKHMHNL